MEALIVLIIAAPFLLLFSIHSWRDIRGARRNESGCCYRCGRGLYRVPGARGISHSKGGTFMYCGPCASREMLGLNIAVWLMIVAVIAFAIVWGMARP
jgi:hypothetical protein